MFNTIKQFMKRNGRLVSGVVLGTRYALGDVSCQYLQVSKRMQDDALAENEFALQQYCERNPAQTEDRPASQSTVVDGGSDECLRSPGVQPNHTTLVTRDGSNAAPAPALLSVRDFLDNHWDRRRTASFVSFGASYYGFPGPGHFVMTKLLPRVFGATRPLAAASFDAGVVTIGMYMPLFYIVMEAWNQIHTLRDVSVETLRSIGSTAFSTYKKNLWQDLMLSVGVWVPFHFLNFKFFPIYARTSVLAVQGTVWVALLSFTRGDDDGPSKGFLAEAEAKVSGFFGGGKNDSVCDGRSQPNTHPSYPDNRETNARVSLLDDS